MAPTQRQLRGQGDKLANVKCVARKILFRGNQNLSNQKARQWEVQMDTADVGEEENESGSFDVLQGAF